MEAENAYSSYGIVNTTHLNRLIFIGGAERIRPSLNQFQHFRLDIFVRCRLDQLAERFTILLQGNFIVHW